MHAKALAIGVFLFVCGWSVCGAFAAEQPGAVAIVKDFVRDFRPEFVTGASASAAGSAERCGGVKAPAIFLHPHLLDDAVLAYPDVKVPPMTTGARTFLVFRIGFRENIPWDGENQPNGVRFSVFINGVSVFSETHSGDGWQSRAIAMEPWAGKPARIEFHTNGIEGNTSYDWALFGEPLLVTLNDVTLPSTQESSPGLILAEITCQEPSRVTLLAGQTRQQFSLEPGTNWVPVYYTNYGAAPRLQVQSGAALLTKTVAAPFAPVLEFQPLLASDLLMAGEPFALSCRVKNSGRGVYNRREGVALVDESGRGAPQQFGSVAAEVKWIPRLECGQEAVLTWDGLVRNEPGVSTVHLNAGGSVECFVFPAEPPLPQERPEADSISIQPAPGIAGIAGNPWSRIAIITGPTRAYGVAEVWNGAKWERAATLYPLDTLALKEQALDVRRDCTVEAVEQVGLALAVKLVRDNWTTIVSFTPDPKAPRIHISAAGQSTHPVNLAAFSGPVVLAGDRSFEAEKDFAFFGGLEYLEGDEPSSSTRDLAYPLNERYVPAIHKLGSPIMAAQGDDLLVALLWDANQSWTTGEKHPAARFNAPGPHDGLRYVHMSVFAPSVGKYIDENSHIAGDRPCALPAGQSVSLDTWLVLDHKSNYAADSIVQGPHRGGLVLQAARHWFELYGLPEPAPQPRDWDTERALCRHAYLDTVWSEQEQGWSHCVGWPPGPMVGYSLPLLLDIATGVSEADAAECRRRMDTVTTRLINEQGKGSLWFHGGCHIVFGELPYYRGYLGESLAALGQLAWGRLNARESGLWVWRPQNENLTVLGTPGDHTLGQAAAPAYQTLRAARLSGDAELAAAALDAMKQMERYEIPRGAQTWECPLYQPDILAAAHAIRAYCEAYRITGDPAHLAHARYWAWTGMPFLYLWEMDGYPTMRYNTISVIGSTFYSHTWIGVPVVWCGMVYAYALQDLAEFDSSFDWRRIAQGITNSTIHQQYTEGPSKGTYPDSWNMAKNTPNPADINPESIYMNEFRLRGNSPEIRCARIERPAMGTVYVNSAADIENAAADDATHLRFTLLPRAGLDTYTSIAPVEPPAAIEGAGPAVPDSESLTAAPAGHCYAADIKALLIKSGAEKHTITLSW